MAHKTDWTQEQKLAAIAEVDSGIPAKTVAERMGVTTSGLAYWRKTLKANGKASKAVVATRKGATPVQTTGPNPNAARDAVVLLRKAKGALMVGIRNGTIDDLDDAHLLSLLALRSLQGH